VNPFDKYALEGAARLKDQNPDAKIVVVTMGPEHAGAALRECLSIAADRAYLVSGRSFGGSDTLATSYILSHAVRAIEAREGKFDAIFCGKQAIDGDTAQVGPELAEHLGYPQVTCALECTEKDGRLEVLKEGQDANLLIGVALPCVITFTKPGWEPRYATLKRRLAANRAEIPTIGEADLAELDTARIGLKGSPTKVKKSFVPPKKAGGIKIQEACAETAVKSLIEHLSGAGLV